MSGGFDDMPPLVEPDHNTDRYRSTPYAPPSALGSSYQYPAIHGETQRSYGGDLWAGTHWPSPVSPTSADYPPATYMQHAPSFLNTPASSSAWHTPTYPPLVSTPARGSSWSMPSTSNTNPAIPSPGTYSPYFASPFGVSTSYHTPPVTSAVPQVQHLPARTEPRSAGGVYSFPSQNIKHPLPLGPTNKSHLSHRPRDWRDDYRAHTSFSSILARRPSSRTPSSHHEFCDETKRTLHSFLQFSSVNPPILLDLRQDPISIQFHHLGRPFNHHDLLQYTCDPPASSMRLRHDKLPWYIDIHATSPTGVTIADLFDQMYDGLMLQIHGKHYYNEDMDDEDRAKINQAFRDRCAHDPNQFAHGVRRVDFLKKHVLLEGLVRGKNGLWEMKTRKL